MNEIIQIIMLDNGSFAQFYAVRQQIKFMEISTLV